MQRLICHPPLLFPIRTYYISDCTSDLLTELVRDTDDALRTLSALLLLEECRPDSPLVVKQNLEDVNYLKEPYGANANRAPRPLANRVSAQSS